MAVQRYDIPVADQPGVFEERWWSTINTPVLGPGGTVAWIIHRVEDVTAFVHSRRARQMPGGQLSEREEAMEAELYARARELQHLNEELRQAHARERQVAVTLQEAMLHSPDLARHRDIAVRYLPAVGSLNVCGDWYDIVDLPGGGIRRRGRRRRRPRAGGRRRHGHAPQRPAAPPSRSVAGPPRRWRCWACTPAPSKGALATTAVQALIDTAPPRGRPTAAPATRRPSCCTPTAPTTLLDQATDPPLGARPEHEPRPQARLAYTPGDTLVLYTDGLIERRDEDIDASLARLTDALSRYSRLSPERLADALLARLGVSGGARDDIALVVVRL